MIRRRTFNLAYVVLCTVSIVITLSVVGERGFHSWYLFTSPLVLAATFFGMRGALATGCAVLASLVLLFRPEMMAAVTASTRPEGLTNAGIVITSTAGLIVSLAEVYGHAVAGTCIMVAGAIGLGYLGDKQRKLQDRVAYMAAHDSLTGLLNRWSFQVEVQKAVEQVQHGQHFGALFFIDLDGFKQVNDRLGHPAGDDLLKKVGEVLTRHTRSHDVAARMGGDEFAVLLPKIDEAYARAVAERIIQQVAAIPVPENVVVTTSAGIALISVATPDAETVLKRADVALYAAKGAGKNRIQYYEQLAASPAAGPVLAAQPAH